MVKLGHLGAGETWPDLTNQNFWIKKGLAIWWLLGLKRSERFQRILCCNCFGFSLSYRGVNIKRVSWFLWCAFRLLRTCALGYLVENALNLETCFVDASKCVEARGGTTNVVPDRPTWLLIWKKIGNNTASYCVSDGISVSGKQSRVWVSDGISTLEVTRS